MSGAVQADMPTSIDRVPLPPRPARRLVAALVVAMLAVALSGCRQGGRATTAPPSPMTMTVASEQWSGWDRDFEATPVTRSMPTDVGSALSVPALTGTATVTITGISGNSVEFRTDDPMAPRETGNGSNHNDLRQQFTVTVGTPVEFSTPTMDAGTTFTVTVTAD